MFIVGIVLVVLGYTVAYYGASMAKAYGAVHTQDIDPSTKGGIPFGVLMGVAKATIPDPQHSANPVQSFPPFVTGTEHHRPKGQ
jgi:hypothetical protein